MAAKSIPEKPSTHSKHLARVRWLSKHGTPEQKRRADYYLRVLRPAAKK